MRKHIRNLALHNKIAYGFRDVRLEAASVGGVLEKRKGCLQSICRIRQNFTRKPGCWRAAERIKLCIPLSLARRDASLPSTDTPSSFKSNSKSSTSWSVTCEQSGKKDDSFYAVEVLHLRNTVVRKTSFG